MTEALKKANKVYSKKIMKITLNKELTIIFKELKATTGNTYTNILKDLLQYASKLPK